MRRRALLSTAAVSVAAVTGCLGVFRDSVQEFREYEFDLPDGAQLRTGIDNGDVDVSTHDAEHVAVDATVSAPSEDRLDDVTVEGVDADDLVLDVQVAGSENRVRVDLDVRVPVGTEVGVVRSRNGDVTVREVAAAWGVGGVNGDVAVRNAGPVSTVETTNGDVAVDVSGPLSEDVSVRSENGDLDVAVAPDVDAAVDAEATNGDVDTNDLELRERNEDGSRVTGVLGDGTRDLTVATTNGDADLRSLA